MSTDELIDAVMRWGEMHELYDAKAQLNKVIEEVGEIAHEVCRNNEHSAAFDDAIGDALVTIIILSNIGGNDPRECLALAYNAIKDRTGQTSNGTFIKSSN